MKEKRAPRNTAQEVRENPYLGIITAIGEDGSGILAQEAQGQSSFVESDTLPTATGLHSDYDTKAILEAAGVKFLDTVEGDDMFQYVELPQGWKKVATDHSQWSKLVDDQGRERASIFYKAAFYDRSAHINLSKRFGVRWDFDRQDKEGVAVAHVTDGDKVIHTTEPIQLPDDDRNRHEAAEQANKAAIEWLDKNHPDWRNPGAYWD